MWGFFGFRHRQDQNVFFRHGDASLRFYAEHKQTVLQITEHKTKMFPALPNASRGRLSVNEWNKVK